MKRILDLLAPSYLGFALSHFANISYDQWEFYYIIIPFFILVKLSKFNRNVENKNDRG
jgi:hypothetical protein